MPRPRIDVFWRDRVKELTEQNQRWSGRKIAAQLEEEAGKANRIDWPSEKTVRNIMAEHRAAPEQERRPYGQVYWPESFGTPELPWESASAVLEAMRILEEGNRLTVRTASWFWRLAIAAPTVRTDERLTWARIMAASETVEHPMAGETRRGLEWQLLHPGMTPPEPLWASLTFEAIETEGIPYPGLAPAVRFDPKWRRKMEKEGQE